MKRPFLISLGALLAASAAAAPMNPAQMKWGPAPDGLPSGARMAVLSGDPGKEGMFTVRLRFPANYTVAPHRHPADELVTVIDGNVSLGMGDRLQRARAANLMRGAYVVAPANMSHFAFTRTGAIIQITAQGPFAITYVNPKDDPRKK